LLISLGEAVPLVVDPLAAGPLHDRRRDAHEEVAGTRRHAIDASARRASSKGPRCRPETGCNRPESRTSLFENADAAPAALAGFDIEPHRPEPCRAEGLKCERVLRYFESRGDERIGKDRKIDLYFSPEPTAEAEE